VSLDKQLSITLQVRLSKLKLNPETQAVHISFLYEPQLFIFGIQNVLSKDKCKPQEHPKHTVFVESRKHEVIKIQYF